MTELERYEEAFTYALPLLRAIAEWEKDNGTVACIMPSEYPGFIKILKKAAMVGSARAALSIMEK